MTDLVEFVRARIGEYEQAAQNATVASSTWSVDASGKFVYVTDAGSWRVTRMGEPAAAIHIARHDPARVLAEVAALRRIVDRYEDCVARVNDPEYPMAIARDQIREYEDFVLPALAGIWADHPDYREEWQP